MTSIMPSRTVGSKRFLTLQAVSAEKVQGILIEDAGGNGLGDVAGEQVLIDTGRLGGGIQALGELGAVEVGAQGQALLRTQGEEVVHMAVQVVQALHVPVLPEEGHKVVQADEALTAHHLPDHVVGEVALVGGHGAGVGVGGGEGLLSHLQQVGEAGVVQVGDVRQDVVLLQLGDQLFAEVGQAVLADVAGADLVLAVPGEGDGLDAINEKRLEALEKTVDIQSRMLADLSLIHI